MQYRPSKVALFNDHIREVKAVFDLRLLDGLLGRDDVAVNLLLLEVGVSINAILDGPQVWFKLVIKAFNVFIQIFH